MKPDNSGTIRVEEEFVDFQYAIMLAGIVGYLGNLGLVVMERRLLHWVGK